MIKEVNRNIRHLEEMFFEEEDSEADIFFEDKLKDDSLPTEVHNEFIARLKDKSHIT